MTITLNYGWAAVPHRDAADKGPSAYIAVGNFRDGELILCTRNDGKQTAQAATKKAALQVPVKEELSSFVSENSMEPRNSVEKMKHGLLRSRIKRGH